MTILLAVAVSRSPYARLVRYTVPVMSSRTGPVAGPELLVEIDRFGELPLHEQLERSLRENIRRGRLPAGAQAALHARARQRAGRLARRRHRGLRPAGGRGLSGDPSGRRRRVARAVRAAVPRAPARSLLPSFPYHFHPGLPDLAGFPRDRWLRSLRAAWRESPLDARGLRRPAWRAPAARSPRRLPGARARRRGGPGEHARLHRLHAGLLDPVPLAARPRRGCDRRRGPRLARAPADRRARRPADDPGARRRARPVRAGPRRHRRRRRARDPSAPVPVRRRAQPRASGGADRMGRGRGAADRRGRLRRRVSL